MARNTIPIFDATLTGLRWRLQIATTDLESLRESVFRTARLTVLAARVGIDLQTLRDYPRSESLMSCSQMFRCYRHCACVWRKCRWLQGDTGHHVVKGSKLLLKWSVLAS